MAEKTIHELLRDSFPKTNRADWQKMAEQETEGKSIDEALTWVSDEGLKMPAYLDAADVQSLQYLQAFPLQPSPSTFMGARAWINQPELNAAGAHANTQALHHLNQGADGLYINITDSSTDFSALLHNINWPYCYLSFEGDHDYIPSLSAYIQQHYAGQPLPGSLFWKSAAHIPVTVDAACKHLPALRTHGIIIPASTSAHEIAHALTEGVAVIDRLTNSGHTVAQAFERIAFSIAAGTDFLSTIAKFKSLRMLWWQVAQAYGHQDYATHAVYVHAYSKPWIQESFQPHGNLLKNTTAAMAAIVGGCDGLTLSAEDANNSMMVRMARNVSSLLREESHFDKVADPSAGAYAIDNLIHHTAAKAWALFQHAAKA